MQAELIYDARATLGEGPFWDHQNDLLIWVDIEEGSVHFYNPANGQDKYRELGTRIGMAVPNTEGHIIAALQDGFAWIIEDSNPIYIADPENDLKNNRFNDGKCDPQGRLWAGTMDLEAEENCGSLYRMNEDLTVSQMISGVSISNGLAWSHDSKTMYYIDTLSYNVMSYEFSPSEGIIANPETVIVIPKDHGAPDGMTIDRDGKLWIAHWGGGNVSRWDPDTGQLMKVIIVPVPQPTSCVFGGSLLDTLYITSARTGLSVQELNEYPESGGLFAVKPGVSGYHSSCFKGKPGRIDDKM